MDTTLTTGTAEAADRRYLEAVDALAEIIEHVELTPVSFGDAADGVDADSEWLATAYIAALRADPAAARAVRDAIDPDGLRAALDAMKEAATNYLLHDGSGIRLAATDRWAGDFDAIGQGEWGRTLRALIEGTPDAD